MELMSLADDKLEGFIRNKYIHLFLSPFGWIRSNINIKFISKLLKSLIS